MKHLRPTTMLLVFCLFLCVAMALPYEAYAETIPGKTCSFDDQFNNTYSIAGNGLISAIVSDMHIILTHMAGRFYFGIILSNSFTSLIAPLLTLYIVLYGIFFTFGMAQITVYDFIVRMVKIGFVVGFIYTGVRTYWLDVFELLNRFFNDGVDAIIGKVTSISVGSVSVVYDPDLPFAVLDEVIAKLLSVKMAVTLLATVFTGPYGLIFGGLMLLAAGSFVRALFMAMWVYLMALILRTMLIALAPLFFMCLLFDRTRHLFSGWMNQMVNTCLQPILMFVFFAFFAALISGSIDKLMETPVCWLEMPDAWRGGPTGTYFWRFAIRGESGAWEPFTGIWAWTGPELNPPRPDVKPFPIEIMAILMFLMLAELAGRFNTIVLTIARDLAGASTDFASMQGPLATWFSPEKGSNENLANNVGKRSAPGGIGYAGENAAQALEEVKQNSAAQGTGNYVQQMSDTLGRR